MGKTASPSPFTSEVSPLSDLTPEVLEALDLTLEEAQVIIEPIKIGPTWQKDALGQWILPEYTLGWEIAAWCADYLKSPKGGPWIFTDEQLRFILWWYAIDERGEWLYQHGVLQRCKGWGKDPLLAVMAIVEFVGPCRFDRWGRNGQPIAKRNDEAWVQIVGVAKSSTKNTFRVFPSIVTDRLVKAHGIEMGQEGWRAHSGRVHMDTISSNHRTVEGGRVTFAVLGETHHWYEGNHGHLLYETIDGNATKMSSRYVSITNAYLPGEDSVAERMRNAYDDIVEGRAADSGFLYDSLEAQPDAPLSGPLVPHVLRGVRGDASWLKVETTMKSILKGNIAPSRSRRMYLNQIVASEEALYGPDQWKPLLSEGAALESGDIITLGFDGGKTDDATALVAMRVSDSTAFKLGVWEAPPHETDWEVDRRSVDSAVRAAFSSYDVVAFFADVALWESYIDTWAEDYGDQLIIKANTKNAVAWDMRAGGDRVTRAHERLVQSVFDAKIKYDGDKTILRHALNAKRWVNKYGLSFRKESRESPRKVDAYAALLLAHEAMTQYRLGGKTRKVKSGYGYFL